jgi:hypothetical protein
MNGEPVFSGYSSSPVEFGQDIDAAFSGKMMFSVLIGRQFCQGYVSYGVGIISPEKA